jgi:hypothetical protein
MTDIRKILKAELSRLDSEIESLKGERSGIAKAMAALSGGESAKSLGPGKRQRKKRTVAQRKAQSEKMKAYWARKRGKEGK